MTAWVFTASLTPVGSVLEARYDGVFATWAEADTSLQTALLDAGVDSWRATSPHNIGALERVWWTGPVDGGGEAGVWRPGYPSPDGARVITRRQLTADYVIT